MAANQQTPHTLLEKGITKEESPALEKLRSSKLKDGSLGTGLAAGPTSTAWQKEGQREG